MAVYTHVSRSDLSALLSRYDIGALHDFEGVKRGVENTNYFVTTDRGRFVLTLFERRVEEGDLPYFLAFMTHLVRKGIPAPHPIADRAGGVLQRLCGRPAVIISFLPGVERMRPSEDDCRAAGGMLARMHLAATDFEGARRNALDLAGWAALADRCAAGADRCAPGLARFAREEFDFVKREWPSGLPAGAVHADLFPDNVFFDGDRVSGVIDFYFSCSDYFAYDLAICLISWCFIDRRWRADSAAAMLAGYEALRPLSALERKSLWTLMRGACLRFMLTRLFDWLNQVDAAIVAVKDPLEYRDLLLHLRNEPAPALLGK